MTLRALLAEARERLSQAGVLTPQVDAELLVEAVFGVGRAGLALEAGREPDPVELERFRELLARRAAREPLQYVLGVAPFLDVELEVGPGCLIPRPETEVVAEAAVGIGRGLEAGSVALDAGAGSGCLAIALARACPHLEVWATDRSPEACAWAEHNVTRLAPGVHVQRRGYFEGVPAGLALVVANPPYVTEAEWAGLEPEIRDHEPREALVAGPTGLEGVHEVLTGAARALRSGGAVVAEIGAGQGGRARVLATGEGFCEVEVLPDLAGRDRVLVARRP